MENLEIILSVAGTALGLLVTTVTFLAKFIKNAKAKKAAENIVDISNALIGYIEEAETFLNYSGEEKKQYVMTKANQFAIESGIKFDAEAVSAKIEELVGMTKQVNVNKSVTASSNSVSSVNNNLQHVRTGVI